ncbi:hypothetical protein [Vallitalea okinawensis]|uniref:hypothetical protein n=1 Tax=Vallitalea okinawensis TaxID=2078660 RepID=UPI000CFD7529|nr:hypothetical protein [Vallitalea okinawensis]
MTLKPSTEIESLVMKKNGQGYIIDSRKHIYYFDIIKEQLTYLMTLNKELEGYVKLMISNNELLLFTRSQQKIYAYSLQDKRQKWYFYQHIKDQEIQDVEIHEQHIIILSKNKRNQYYYLNELDLLNETLINKKRFKNKCYLHIGRYKECLILFDEKYEIHERLDLQTYCDLDKKANILVNNLNEKYFLNDNYIVTYDNHFKAIEYYNTDNYLVGINTVLE